MDEFNNAPSTKPPNIDTSAELRKQIEQIADQLCLAVKGDFGFTVEACSTEQSIQKLTMLVNFVIDTARRALSEVNEQNAKLTELDKLKTDFMANISHELRTPLTLILAPLETILSQNEAHKGASIPPEHQENLDCMHRNAIRLYVLVNDLLDLSKMEAGKFVVHDELLDLNLLTEEIVGDAQGLAQERNLILDFVPCPDLNLLLFDRKMTEKILLNLISNALKFTPKGGSVHVQLEKKLETVYLIVSDTGVGIPEAQISDLFERFHQVDTSSTRVHEGTGIGLALVGQFVDLMGGKIKVDSKVGKGARFTISLPIRSLAPTKNKGEKTIHQEEENSLSTPIKVSLSKLSLNKKEKIQEDTADGSLPLILIADDNPDMRAYMISLLKDSYRIIAVENGKLALKAVYKYQPQVILSDVMMPVMDGFELAKQLKADPTIQHIPIILITAKAGKEAIVVGLEVGADDYLAKPFSPEELKARTHCALRLHQNFTKVQDLNNQLRGEIEERKRLELKNATINEELIVAARRAGMADIATSVLHNVGNVLNTVNTSATLIGHKISSSKVSNLRDCAELIQEHEADMATFFTQDPQGQILPDYLIKLSEAWNADKQYLLSELKSVEQGIQHIKEIVRRQNSLCSTSGNDKDIHISELIEDALLLNKASYESLQVSIERDFNPLKQATIDRIKLLQIIVNLIKNGIESVIENNPKNKVLGLKIQEKDKDNFLIQVSDNGVGISEENLRQIFKFGFTTKKNGHGFGLHSSAISAQEMGGEFYAESDGPGKGATFSLVLPYQYTAHQNQNEIKE